METRTVRTRGSPTCSSERSPSSWTETFARPQTRDSAERNGINVAYESLNYITDCLCQKVSEDAAHRRLNGLSRIRRKNCLIIGKWIIEGIENTLAQMSVLSAICENIHNCYIPVTNDQKLKVGLS